MQKSQITGTDTTELVRRANIISRRIDNRPSQGSRAEFDVICDELRKRKVELDEHVRCPINY